MICNVQTMPNELSKERRRFLQLTGATAVVGLAGCGGNGNGDGGDGGDGGGGDGEVPSEYEGATALDGTEYDPGADLLAQGDVQYQEEPSGGEACENCRFYVPDQNDDGMGACVEVEGLIDPQGWCTLFQEFEGDGGNETDGNETDGNETGNESA